MRPVTIVVLALLCGGCAAPSFDLVSRDPESPWLVGNHWVRTESSRASVNTAFAKTFLDYLVFDVEVVNQSDSTLVVDPQGFSYTLSSSGKDLSKKLRQRFSAASPDAVMARLDRAVARGADESLAVTALAGLIVIAAVAMNFVDFGDMMDSQQLDPSAALAVSDDVPEPPDQGSWPHDAWGAGPVPPASPEPDYRRARAAFLTRLLQRTTLGPGESVRGEVWLPAKPVTQAMGHVSQPNDMSITAVSSRTLPDHGLTLRTPIELGGQEIEFSVAPEW